MKAIDEIIVGFEKRERLMSSEEKRIVSYHEAGHCLLAYLLEGCSNPIKVSIVPRGDAALGFSQSESDDRKLWKKSELIDRLSIIQLKEVFIPEHKLEYAKDIVRKNRIYKNTVVWNGVDSGLDLKNINQENVWKLSREESAKYVQNTLNEDNKFYTVYNINESKYFLGIF
jgi:hypothetical protein